MNSRPASLLLLLLGVVAASSDALAVRAPRPLRDLPGWIQEAATRKAPAAAGSSAEVLHDELIVAPGPDGVRLEQRIAIRVLDAAAGTRHARHVVTYKRGEPVPEVFACTIRGDGTAIMVDPPVDIVDEPDIDGVSLFGDVRRVTVRAPSPVAGDIVAVAITSVWTVVDPGLVRFPFGSADEPTALARLVLQLPPGWSGDIVTRGGDGLVTSRDGQRTTVTATGLSALPRHPLRPPIRELLPEGFARWQSPDGTHGFADWNGVARFTRTIAEPQLAASKAATAAGETLRPSAPGSIADAMARAYELAARKVRYVSIDIGLSGFRPHAPDDVLRTEFGDCKDKAFLLRALAASWGVRSFPVLVRTRPLGPVHPDVPGLQFDHMIAALLLPAEVTGSLWSTIEIPGHGRAVLIDATADSSSPWHLPEGDQGTLALVVTPDDGHLVRLPEQPAATSTTKHVFEGVLDGTGALASGSVDETWVGGEAGRTRAALGNLKRSDAERRLREAVAARATGMELGEWSVDGLEQVVSDLHRRYTVHGRGLAQFVDGMLIVEPARLVRGAADWSLPAPPIPWPADGGAPSTDTIEATVAIPAGWSPESLPADVTIESEDVAASCSWRMNEGRLTYVRQLVYKTWEIPPERYAAVREHLSKVKRADARGIVFKRIQ